MATLNIIYSMKKKNTREWSNLPSDLWQEIMAKLHWADRIRFCYVCKNWLSLPFHKCRDTVDKLPWLLTFSGLGPHTKFNLFDPPFHTKPYSSFEIRVSENVPILPPTKTSKNGWVFLATDEFEHTSFILFSPFTMETITLPDFHYSIPHTPKMSKAITFSSEPTSEDCVFFILLAGGCGEVLGTYKRGDKQWITKALNRGSMWYTRIEYLEGDLYCMNVDWGYSTVYNVDK